MRDAGFLSMANVMDGRGALIDWTEAQVRGALPFCERAFTELCANLHLAPIFAQSFGCSDFYVESTEGPRVAWK